MKWNVCVCGSTIRFTNLQTNSVCVWIIFVKKNKLTWLGTTVLENLERKIFSLDCYTAAAFFVEWIFLYAYHWHFFWLYGYRQWFMILKEGKCLIIHILYTDLSLTDWLNEKKLFSLLWSYLSNIYISYYIVGETKTTTTKMANKQTNKQFSTFSKYTSFIHSGVENRVKGINDFCQM